MSWLGSVRRMLFGQRIRALMVKEFNQIRRDRRLVISLVIPPLLQLTLFGYALSASVSDLRLGIVDESRTRESRELIAALTESRSFRLGAYYPSSGNLGDAISQGRADAGVVIPYDFARDLRRGRGTTVQVVLNAMNANTATIGQGYAEGVIQSYNQPSPPRRTARDAPDRSAWCPLTSTTRAWSTRGSSPPASSAS